MIFKKLPQQFLILVFITSLVWGCKKSSMDNPPSPTQGNPDSLAATINNPTTLNVYPAIVNNGAGVGRVFIKTLQVGAVNVNVPLLFDTGSAGVTLSAQSVFPATLVDQTGFKFRAGQDTIQYQGITVTKINVVKIYGSAGATETREIGNIGYATLAVGDVTGSVRMLKMPILFYYQTLANGVPTSTGLGPVFGVNATYNGAQSTQDTSYIFKQVSPLKYLLYKNSVIAGFKLNAISLSGCEINTTGSCAPQALFTIGLTSADEATYAVNDLVPLSPQPAFISPQGYPGFPSYTTFDPTIKNAVVSTAVRSKNVSVLLDSGNPGVILNLVKDSLNITNYPNITLTTPTKSTYTYNYNTASFTTSFNTASSRSVYGVYFFTQFNFLEDYQNGKLGLKVKQAMP